MSYVRPALLSLCLTACAGTVGPTADAGPERIDAGVVPSDAGPFVRDAGLDAFDAGLVTRDYEPTAALLPNPERGFFTWVADDLASHVDEAALDDAFAAGHRLVYAQVKLGAWRDTSIPASTLEALRSNLGTITRHGLKVVLRFLYDDTAGGNDATAAQIELHLRQLAPVLAEHAPAIGFLEAGFIGAWGEWHSSKHSNSYGYMTNPGVTEPEAHANRLRVRDALYASVPVDVPIVFRYPADLIRWFPSPLSQARAGFHDDCFLSGPSDTGTWNSDDERAFITTLTDRAAFGGETCDGERPLRTDCASVLSEGARYHLGFLNHDFFRTFHDAWAMQGCLDELTRRMGPRIVIDRVTHPARARSGTITLTVTLHNEGWARPQRARPLELRLVRNGEVIAAKTDFTLDDLPPQRTEGTDVTFTVEVPPRQAPSVWELVLAAPDPAVSLAGDPRYAIHFANADTVRSRWDAETGVFQLGTSMEFAE